jgi:putative oxidoreductase
MIGRSETINLDWTRPTLLVGRVCLSAIFLISGVAKLMYPEATVAQIEAAGLPFPEFGRAIAIAVELLGGGALLAGFRTRWAASILAAFTFATALLFHSSFVDPNQFTHFLKNVAMTGGLLYVAVLGSGTRPLPQ